MVYLQVASGEAAVARRIKQAGDHRRGYCKLWAIRYGQAEQLQILDRKVDPEEH
jgi:hypothetical protein